MTPREPDRYEEKARERAEALFVRVMGTMTSNKCIDLIVAALRREREAALNEAARDAETYCPLNASVSALVLAREIAVHIRSLASPAAAPAWMPPRDAMTGMTAAEEMRAAGIDVLRGARPAAAPAPGVEDVARAHRRYDAMAVHPLDPLVRVIVEPCERGGHYRNERGATFHPSPCASPPGAGERK